MQGMPASRVNRLAGLQALVVQTVLFKDVTAEVPRLFPLYLQAIGGAVRADTAYAQAVKWQASFPG